MGWSRQPVELAPMDVGVAAILGEPAPRRQLVGVELGGGFRGHDLFVGFFADDGQQPVLAQRGDRRHGRIVLGQQFEGIVGHALGRQDRAQVGNFDFGGLSHCGVPLSFRSVNIILPNL